MQQTATIRSESFYNLMEKIARYSMHGLLIFLSLLCLVPFLIIVSASLTDETALTVQGYGLIPHDFSTTAYDFALENLGENFRAFVENVALSIVIGAAIVLVGAFVLHQFYRRYQDLNRRTIFYVFVAAVVVLTAYQELSSPRLTGIWRAYFVTINVTVIGTFLALTMMAMLAYPLSRQQFFLRRPMSLFVFFTMLFSGGLVPYYILVTQYLRLTDTFVILLIPQLVGVFQVLLLRTYFAQLPEELFDAARVDGAGEWRIFFSIVLPLAKPALATVGLMVALAYWNNWTTALYFIRSSELYPLQYLLYRIMENANAMAVEPQLGAVQLPLQSTRMAMAVLATGPAAIGFLFVQKYLVRGITLGSFK